MPLTVSLAMAITALIIAVAALLLAIDNHRNN